MYFVEWAPEPKRRKGRMVSLKALNILCKSSDPGYSSVYLFSEADAETIKRLGHSKGLSSYPVSSSFLIFDIDSGESSLRHVEKALKEKGLGFEVWESGGKGYHVYVTHQFVTSSDLPYSHSRAALQMIPNAVQHIDLSLYQHGRLLSLPGRIHPRTRKKKKFLYSVGGASLELPVLKKPQIEFSVVSEADESILGRSFDQLLSMLLSPPYVGNRHTTIWAVSKDLMNSGLKYETALDLMQKVNEVWKNQKSPAEIELAVKQAYGLKI